MNRFKRIKDFYKKHSRTYLLGIFWLFLVDTIQLIRPKVIGSLIDNFQDGSMTNNRIINYALLLLIMGVISGICRYFWRIYISGNSGIMSYDLRRDFFNHLLKLNPEFYHNNMTGDLMSRGTNDINIVRRSFGISIIMFLDSLYLIVSAIIMMILTTNLKLTLIAGLNLPIIIIFTRYFGRLIFKRSYASQESFAQVSQNAQESFSGIRVIKSFAQEDEVYDKFVDINKNNYEKNLHLVKASGLFIPGIRFIYYISVLMTILFGGKAVINGTISLGDFVAFNMYITTLHWPVRSIGMIVNNIQRGSAALERLEEIYSQKPWVSEAEVTSPITFKDAIEFKNVSFKYPSSNRYALKDISFKIKPGKTTAIIGRTGSGKSTIANLLVRLYDIEEGSILFDGNSIMNLSFKDLRENISYIPQDNFLFSKTIKYNIGFSLPFGQEIPDQEVYQASELADVYKDIIDFPEQFDTILGERGITLSGGQQQRTSMARGFFKDSHLLILDDSLSAVDTETEKQILHNINTKLKDRSKLIISHRVSAIQEADEILVLDDGEIIERGSHEELLAYGGLYQDIYKNQLLEEGSHEA